MTIMDGVVTLRPMHSDSVDQWFSVHKTLSHTLTRFEVSQTYNYSIRSKPADAFSPVTHSQSDDE